MIVAATPDERRARDEMARWGRARRSKLGELGAFDARDWSEFAQLGLLHGSVDDVPLTHVAAGLLGAAQGGLSGPVLEAELACASGCSEATNALRDGHVVTSVPPGPAGPTIVGWGSLAELVVDQADGRVVARAPLDAIDTALPMGHGVIDRAEGAVDPLRLRRWVIGAALVVGLSNGALEMAAEHVKEREQFGRKLSTFQAVQFRLAETVHVLEAAELMVLDAARREVADDPHADVASALAWAYAYDAGALAEKQTHQVFGALGFAEETGLVRLTYQMAWLRTSIGVDPALDHLDQRRLRAEGVPPSTVLGGFRPAGAG